MANNRYEISDSVILLHDKTYHEDYEFMLANVYVDMNIYLSRKDILKLINVLKEIIEIDDKKDKE